MLGDGVKEGGGAGGRNRVNSLTLQGLCKGEKITAVCPGCVVALGMHWCVNFFKLCAPSIYS